LKPGHEDFMTTFYIEQCDMLSQNPPNDDWTGVIVMDSK
jgi:hypothetical protein